MLLEKLLKGANFSINIFNLEESKLFDQYFERILILSLIHISEPTRP